MRKLIYTLSVLLCLVLLVCATAVWTLRSGLELPHAVEPKIEQFLFERLNQKSDISGVRLGWRKYGPELRLRHVRMTDIKTGDRSLAFKEIALGLDLVRSLVLNRPAISFVNLVGAQFNLQQKPDGTWQLAGIPIGSPSTQGQPVSFTERLGLQNVAIILSDIQVQVEYQHRDVEIYYVEKLELSHRARRLKLAGILELPPTLGERVWLSGWIGEELLVSQPWHGDIYLKGSHVNLGYWQRFIAQDTLKIQKGVADVQVWTQWRGGKLQRARGKLQARQAYVSAAQWGLSAPLQLFSTQFDWHWEAGIWKIIFADLQFQSNAVAAHGMHFSLEQQGSQSQEAQNDGHQIRIARAYLQHLHGVLKLLPKLAPESLQRLNHIQPTGEITDAVLNIFPGRAKDALQFSGRVDNLKLAPSKPFPGVDGIDARIVASESHGQIELITREGHLWFEHLYTHPFSIGEASGTVHWQQQDKSLKIWGDALRVQSPELSARGQFVLEHQDQMPHLDFQVNVDQVQLQHLAEYIPLSAKARTARQWLDGAFKGGQLVNGEVRLSGPLNSIPFRHGEGEVFASGTIQGGQLHYAKGFPMATDLNGTMSLKRGHLTVDAHSAKTYSFQAHQVHAEIQDLFRTPLKLDLELSATGQASDGFRYLTQSPLKQGIGALFPKVQAEGPIQFDLKFSKLLTPHSRPSIAGHIELKDNSVHFPNWVLPLHSLQGKLNFTETGVSSEKIIGKLFGGPFSLNIGHRKSAQTERMTFDMQGEVQIRSLSEYFKFTPFQNLSGSSAYQAQLQVQTAQPKSAPQVNLEITSNLNGVGINAPEPMHKQAQSEWPLKLTLKRTVEGNSRWKAMLNHNIYFSYDINKHNQARAELTVPNVEVSVWQPFIAQQLSMSKPAKVSQPNKHQLNSLYIYPGTLNLYGNLFDAPTLMLRREPPEWYLGIDHEQIFGGMRMHASDPLVPIQVRFERAKLEHGIQFPIAARDENNVRDLSPTSIPALNVDIRSLNYAGRVVGDVQATVDKLKEGLRLSALNLNSSHQSFSAHGNWIHNSKGQQLDLHGISKIRDLGKFLEDLGIKDRVSEGKGQVNADLNWSTVDRGLFKPEHLAGQVSLKIKDGRLINADPGPGKVLGIFSVSSIPRRLLLDFSDLFKTGLTFDKAEAQFSISQGIVRTEQFDIQGPAAQIEIRGKTDLVARRFDQKIAVMPNIGGTLPVAGAIAGGPGLGALLFLGQDIVNKRIGKIIRYELALTGPWSEPKLERN